jgi:hypothetical protein
LVKRKKGYIFVSTNKLLIIMGLDMYLSKKTYVKNWDHMSAEERHEVIVKKNGQEVPSIKKERISSIEESVAQWRKANHIHQWFVDNIQGGDDNCREYYVDRDQLRELVEVCKTVKESLEKSPKKTVKVEIGWKNGEKLYDDVEVFEDTSLAEELLPTQTGFFFGGTEYDEWYLKSLDNTIEMLEPLLDEEGGEFYYQSSW